MSLTLTPNSNPNLNPNPNLQVALLSSLFYEPCGRGGVGDTTRMEWGALEREGIQHMCGRAQLFLGTQLEGLRLQLELELGLGLGVGCKLEFGIGLGLRGVGIG